MSKKGIGCLSMIGFLIIAGIIVYFATATQPKWPETREGDPVPARPQPDDPIFHTEPLAETFEERRELYFQYVAEKETPDERGGIWTDIIKLEHDPETEINAVALQAAIDHVNSGEDTGDFTMTSLLRLYYKHGDKLTEQQRSDIEQAILDFKYWLDEPNPVYTEMWTENHQMLSHSAEFLAGQLFPDETFTNNGETGAWRMAHAREKIMHWIDWHSRTGMSEWDSSTYYRMNIAALMNLVDFAEDEELATKAAALIDLLLFDIAVDSYYGIYGTPHGRITAPAIKSGAGDSAMNLQAIAWGLGRFQSTDMGSASLVTSDNYEIPPVIQAIAQDMPDEYWNYERHSIPVTDEAAAQWGLSFDNIEDAPVWFGMGAFTDPKVIDLTLTAADEWGLWHYPDFAALKDLAGVLQSLGIASQASTIFNPDPNGNVMSEVNKITYRTPEYMLSSAQDYLKGNKGYQQHIWQATLDPYAVVFVTNPDSMAEDKDRPNYWAGQGRMPRTAQYDNVLISLYDIDSHPSPSILEARHYAFTHALFPRWAFDEVVEVPVEEGGGWIFGRKGDAYIALYSHEPYEWQTEGPDADQEIIALGNQNVWLTQLGRSADDGSFEEFIEAITNAPLDVDGLSVEFGSPGNGLIAFSWDDPLTLDSEEIPLRDYPRWDNPYSQTEFGSSQFEIDFAGEGLSLDFETATREIR